MTSAPARVGIEGKGEVILAAALELFAERGFHGTAVPLVADKAGVGAGTIYRYFDSKEALVNALYRKWKSALVERVLSGFPVDAGGQEQITALWRRMAEFALEHPSAIAFLELHHHGSYLDEASWGIERAITNFAVEQLRKAQAAGQVKTTDPELQVALVRGAFIGVVRACREGHCPAAMATFQAAEPGLWDLLRA